MWKDPDPGGQSPKDQQKGPSVQELSDLRDQNEQHLLLIAQLKEMLRKEQSNVTQEKVEEYVNTLSKVSKAKKSRTKRDESGSSGRSGSTVNIDSYKKERVNLLRQQLEENKAKLAERDKHQKGIEEMVTQLQAQFQDSQQLISLTPLNLSLSEPKNVDYSKNTPQEDLYNILLTKEKRITELLNKTQKLENTVLDLQENLKEKDSVIDARTKAITLMTDSLSKKGKSTLDALDETKEQMRKMQENFVILEHEMKARQVMLLNDLKSKNLEIGDLQESLGKVEEEKLALLNELKLVKGDTNSEDIDVGALRVNLEEMRLENETYQARILEFENSLGENSKEIDELHVKLKETNEENKKYVAKISELEKQLQETSTDLERLKNVGFSVNVKETDNSEVMKLKKQLDESNKNMIKVKAQHKSKIKELNKKIDEFKKVSDSNAFIVQLQAENTKLNEQIAVLEDEKGNMQLKMVESSSSSKDSSELEEKLKEVEEKLSRSLEEIDEKDKIISLLESDILSLKEELRVTSEKLDKMSHLENMQVTSEITSIHYEEQLEIIAEEKKKIIEEKENLVKERDGVLEKIEILKREKEEISTKLENYIQENMELIDKLEKLSAEKVSSAESIEIVEGLTQQEKLELAAYQKTVDVHCEAVKCADEDNLEPPAELNESVLQLNEDTTELLQKIDMFTQERKEVMVKMESLKEENNALALKVKEIENNRDVLVETYEQLQNEKEVLLNEKEELAFRLEKLKGDGQDNEKVNKTIEELKSELQHLKIQYEEVSSENQGLKRTLKEFDTVIHEKHNLEIELQTARDKINELESNLDSNLEEIRNYQTVIEENKNDLINSSTLINELQTKLTERENDVQDLNTMIEDLNKIVNNLQNENIKLGDYEKMESQLNELRTVLNNQLEQTQEYETEIAQNTETIKNLNVELIEINRRMLEYENEMEVKNEEMQKLRKELGNKEEIVKNLQEVQEEKDKKFRIISEDIKDKYLKMQKQLDGNSETWQLKVDELTNKNKEQFEKMKKIAANLKKKTQAHQELQQQYNGAKEKWEAEAREKDVVILKSEEKITSLLHQLRDLEEEIKNKNSILEEAYQEVKFLKQKVNDLEQKNVDTQNYILELKHKEEKMNEISLQQELSASLHEDFSTKLSATENIYREKITELEMVTESKERELRHHKERTSHLEEHISKLEEETSVLEKRNRELEEKLDLTSNSFKEKALLEDQLELKLAEISASDEALNKKLQETTKEYQELIKKNMENEELIKKLKIKLKRSHDKVNELRSLQTNLEELENMNDELKKQVLTLEANQKQIQNENESLQKRNMSDYEKIEADCQIQLEELLREKNDLTVELEKCREKIIEMQEKEEELLLEIEESRYKLEQSKSMEQNQIEELKRTTENYESSKQEIEQLKQQVLDLQNELLVKTAKITVDTVIEEASRRISNTVGIQTEDIFTAPQDQATVPTFQWPTQAQNEEISTSVVDFFSTVPQENVNDNKQNIPNISSNQGTNWFNAEKSEAELQVLQLQDHSSQAVTQIPIAPAVENSREELLSKIKALEFLLYNVDKEKEIALSECTEMINAVTDLICEKTNFTQKSTNQSNSDLQPSTSDQHKSISDIHHPTSDIPQPTSDARQSISDIHHPTSDILQSTSDLYCHTQDFNRLSSDGYPTSDFHQSFDNEQSVSYPLTSEFSHLSLDPPHSTSLHPAPEFRQKFPDLDAQIFSETDIAAAAANKKGLQQIEYDKTDLPIRGEQLLPVVEEVIKPEKTYLGYSDGKSSEKHYSAAAVGALGENDDGWGWGPEEAKLEEEHISRTESSPQMQVLRHEIEQLKEKLRVLQVERENHLEEIKQLQIKSGKLIKKCKELKLKNDQLSKKSDLGDVFDLNETIQEELKNQVQQLERQIKEIMAELEREKLEKKGILKRVDILTSANERMLEMKEIQDTEVLRWQRKHQEVLEKLQQQEWGNDGFSEGTRQKETPSASSDPADQKRVAELEKIVNELTLDNDELQTLLEEQRTLRLEAEKVKSVSDGSRTEDEFNQLLNSRDTLNQKVLQLEEKLRSASEDSTEAHVLVDEKKKLMEDMENMRKIIGEKEIIIGHLQENVEQLNQNNSEISDILTEKDKTIEHLQKKSEDVQMIITDLQKQIGNLEEWKNQREDILIEKDELIEELQSTFDLLSNKKVEMEKTIKDLNMELDQHKQLVEEMRQENERKALEFQQLQRQDHTEQVQVEEKEATINDLKKMLEESEAQRAVLEKELVEQKEILEQKIENNKHLQDEVDEKVIRIERLQNILQEKDNEFATKLSELASSWEMQVDQRGADVAESWKLHLESVQSEFAALEYKLKQDVTELEEKCNILVNENNELRKNVDAEIRNEIDKISELQQQVTNNQHVISDLNKMVEDKQMRIDDIENEIRQLQAELAEKDKKLESVNIVIDTTQKQFDEKREVVEEIVRILEKNTSWPISYEKQEVLNEFQRQLGIIDEKEQEITRLKREIYDSQSHLNETAEKDQEIALLRQNIEDYQSRYLADIAERDQQIALLNQTIDEFQSRHLTEVAEKDQQITLLSQNTNDFQSRHLTEVAEKDQQIALLSQTIDDFQSRLNVISDKEQEILRLNDIIADLQQQVSAVFDKDQEISRLNTIIERSEVNKDLAEQELQRLEQEHFNCNIVLEDYRQKLEEFKATHLILQNTIEEKNQLIITLNEQLQATVDLKEDNNRTVERLESDISRLKQDCSVLQEGLSESQTQLFNANQQLADKIKDLETVRQQLSYSQENFHLQEEELNKLKNQLQEKEIQYSNVLEQLRQSQLDDLQSQYEELLSAKDLDVQNVQAQMGQLLKHNEEINEELAMGVKMKEALEERIGQLSALLEEQENQRNDLKAIIEDQTLKIEELKKELFEKSSQFDGLIAEMDISRQPVTQQPSPSTDRNVPDFSTSTPASQQSREDDLSEPVSRAELDLALYMLHQRDVRCEELTVELTQLLEERDTLQLRLSNAIREKEELRKKMTVSDETLPTSSNPAAGHSPQSRSSAIFLAASGTELAMDPLETSSGDLNLATKLSELKNVGYKKDKTFVDEQQLRRIQQLSIMQQHINEASKLPPEAAAKLVDATYTLSRDVQSPSKVLLNWLWGRSTPKVNDT